MSTRLPIRPEGHVLVDDDVAEALRRALRRGWCIRRNANGEKRPELVIPNGKRWGERVRLARLVTHAPPHLFPLHINGDVLDCRRVNLRLVVSRGEAGGAPMLPTAPA